MTGNPAAKKREKERARKERQAEKDQKRKERRNNPSASDDGLNPDGTLKEPEPSAEGEVAPPDAAL